MNKLLVSLFLGISLLFGLYWFFLKPDPDWRALEAFKQLNWEKANQELDQVKSKLSPNKAALYAGYIARAKGDIPESDKQFKQAQEGNPPLRLSEEIFVNQAYNAFIERKADEMQAALKELAKKRSVWNQFLANLHAFLKNSSAENLNKLEKLPIPPPLSIWMEAAFASSFTPFWFTSQTASTLIEEGNTVQARQQLEKIATLGTEKEQQEVTYLIGKSYLKEAEDRPTLAATPYYKLAFAYFDRIPFQASEYQKKREDALTQVLKQIHLLIEEGHFDDLPIYAALVEKWGTLPEKETLAEQLSQLIHQKGFNASLGAALSKLTSAPKSQAALVEEAREAIQNTSFGEDSTTHQTFGESALFTPALQQFYLERAQENFSKGDLEQADLSMRLGLALAPQTQLFLKQALPLIAQIFTQKGDPYNAVLAWNKNYNLTPLDALGRIEYAQALMDVLRYDIANAQFAFMEKNALLTIPDQLLYIDSLTRSGQFEAVKEKAEELLPKLDGQQRLRLSGIVAPLNNKTLTEKLLKELPPKDKWDDALKLAAFQASLDRGDYDQTARLYAAEKTLLNKSGEGKFLLARFYSQIGNPKMALKYAQEAEQMGNHSFGLSTFIEQNTLDAAGLRKRLAQGEQKLQLDPENLYLQLQMGQILIDYAIAAHDKAGLPISKMPELRSAYALLNGISSKMQEFPLYHFLFGLSSFLLDQDDAAKLELEKALALSPGYPDAAKYLALLYSNQGQGNKAVQVLLSALKIHPIDGEGWQVLFDIYFVGGEGLEAGMALDNALHYRPNNVNTLLSAAAYKIELQNPQAALIYVDKALKITPQNQKGLLLKIKILNSPLLIEQESRDSLREKIKQTLEELRKVNPNLAIKIEKELNS